MENIERNEYHSTTGNLIRGAGIAQAIVAVVCASVLGDENGWIAGVIIGAVLCFFSYGFGVIVDAANLYLELNEKKVVNKKRKASNIPETPEEIDVWIKKGDNTECDC